MAADVVLGSDSANPCCAEMKKRLVEMEENRNALREAVKILKKAFKEEQVQRELEKERESRIRQKLEREIHDLKLEASSFQKSGCLRAVDGDKSALLETRMLEGEAEIRRLKELLEKEEKKGEYEKKKAEAKKKKAAEAWKLVKIEKVKVEEERRHAEIEKNKAEECRLCLEKLKIEVKEARDKYIAERSKADDANKKVDLEKQKMNKEKKRADAEREKAEEQMRLTEIERKKAMAEKVCVDNLSQQLEEEKQRREELQKQIEEFVSAGRGKMHCSCFGDGRCNNNANTEITDVNLLREQLKLEKKKVKLAKRMAKLEKAEKGLLKQELHLLKQDFTQFSSRLSMVDGRLSRHIKGTDGPGKIGKSSDRRGFDIQNKFSSIKPSGSNLLSDFELTKTCCTDSLKYPVSTTEYTALPLSRGNCTRPISGNSSEMESPVGGSVRNKSQSSVVCSTTRSFSHRKFMGSQGGDPFCITTSSKLAEKKLKQRPTFAKLSSKGARTRQNENMVVVEENISRDVPRRVENACLSSSVNDGIESAYRVSGRSKKKRRTQDPLESVLLLHLEDNQLHPKIREKSFVLKDLLSNKDSIPTVVRCGSCGITKPLDDGSALLEKPDYLHRRKCKSNRSMKVHEQHTPDWQPFDQNDNQNQTRKLENDGGREPCFLTVTTTPAHQMRESVHSCMDEPISAFSSDWAALICFENMICGDVLKLLDLDSDADERMYKKALEMPLSPTLPEIEFPSPQLYGEDSHFVVDGLLCSGTERDDSAPFQTFDVIDLEIYSNRLKLKTANAPRELLSHNNRIFHSSEAAGNTGVIKLNCEFNEHDMLNGIGHNSFYLGNGRYLDDEKIRDANESNDFVSNIELRPCIMESKELDQQGKPLLQCRLDHAVTPNSVTSGAAVSGKTNEPFLSGDRIHSLSKSTPDYKLSHNDECIQGCCLEFSNLGRNTCPVADGPNETFEATPVTNSELTENEVNDKGKELEDPTVAQHVYHGILDSETGKLMGGENSFFGAGKACQTGTHQVLESGGETGATKQLPSSTIRKLVDPCRGNHGHGLERTPRYCIVFSNTKDEGSVYRITHAMDTFKYQTDCMVVELLHALVLERNLIPEEKVSVFLSLSLYNISGTVSADTNRFMNDVILRSQSFAADLKRVIADEEIRCLFLETFHLDILFSQLEEFLIERKLLMYTERLHEPLLSSDDSSSKFYHLDGRNMSVSSRAASTDQLLAASYILASICAAVDDVGFLLETSYKILLMCRDDAFWILSALHAFASVGGKTFFTLDSYSFLTNVIKSVVSLLERAHESFSSLSPCFHSSCDEAPSFPPCNQCPFAIAAVSVDNILSLLLELLQDNASTGRHSNANKSIVSSMYRVLTYAERDKETTDCKKELVDLNLDCNTSCVLFKHRKHAANQSDCTMERNFCYFTDIISLVELVGCYMSWEWTYNEVMPSLLQILGSCVSEEFSAALFVLIGQLGRLGIDAGGYQQIGIAELSYSLSMYLDRNIPWKRGLHTQFAIVGALLQNLETLLRDTWSCQCIQVSPVMSNL